MNVRLAAQTLSNSVGDGLILMKAINAEFEAVDGTVEFCKSINNIFDLLNCRTRYKVHTLRQPFCVPLRRENFEELKKWAQQKIEYIKGLQDHNGIPLVSASYGRKCGFRGFIICLENILELFELLNAKYKLEYILTYKLLQHPIENLFSAIRMMGGFRNNPTPY